MKANKLLIFLCSVVVAFAMWLYVITIVSPESEEVFYNVPVVLQGEALLEDQGLMLIMEEKPTVTLTLTGNRSDLIKLNSSNITVVADLSKIYEAGQHSLTYNNNNITYPGDIAAGAISVKSREPSNIAVTVEKKIADKPVDVVIEDNDTNVAKGFIIQETKLDREQILITGPASVVDQIAMARIDVDYDGRNKSFGEDFFITLCDEDGAPVDSRWVEVDASSVYLTVIVHQVKQILLAVEVKNGGGATEETSDISLSIESIAVSGSEDDLKKLDEILVDGTLVLGSIDLAEYSEDTELEFDIVLPTGVQVVGDTQKAKVSVKFPDLQIQELTVTTFEAINVPEGMEAQILAQELKVRIRGPIEIMETLKPEDVKIVLDLTGAKLGNSNIAARVELLNDVSSGAGALGTYSVAVSLVEAEETE